ELLNSCAEPYCGRLSWRNRFRYRRSRLGFVPDSLTPKKINAAIVSDAKQPRLQGTAVVELVQLAISLDQCLLHDIFAVHDRTRHARTVPVQTRPKRGDGLQKRQIACVHCAGAVYVVSRV